MKKVLETYIGTTIGVNVERLSYIDGVELLDVSHTYFSVRTPADQHIHHIPYSNVLRITEDDQGVEARRRLFTTNERFNLIVKIGHGTVLTN